MSHRCDVDLGQDVVREVRLDVHVDDAVDRVFGTRGLEEPLELERHLIFGETLPHRIDPFVRGERRGSDRVDPGRLKVEA